MSKPDEEYTVPCDKTNCYGCKDGLCQVLRSEWNWKKKDCPFYRDYEELKEEEIKLYGSTLIKPWEL